MLSALRPASLRPSLSCDLATPPFFTTLSLDFSSADANPLLLSSPICVISKPHAGTEAHGMIFVKNVSDAYELGTKRRGEAVLST